MLFSLRIESVVFLSNFWIPAFAGMALGKDTCLVVIPAKAGTQEKIMTQAAPGKKTQLLVLKQV
jgi:hypothetical protein